MVTIHCCGLHRESEVSTQSNNQWPFWVFWTLPEAKSVHNHHSNQMFVCLSPHDFVETKLLWLWFPCNCASANVFRILLRWLTRWSLYIFCLKNVMKNKYIWMILDSFFRYLTACQLSSELRNSSQEGSFTPFLLFFTLCSRVPRFMLKDRSAHPCIYRVFQNKC